MCKNKNCDKEFNRKEVERILGEYSRPAMLGYCSAYCYTQDRILSK